MRPPVAVINERAQCLLLRRCDCYCDVPEPCDSTAGCEMLFAAGASGTVGVEPELQPLNRMLEIVAIRARRIAGNMNCSLV